MCGAMTWSSDYNLIGALGNAGKFGLLAGGIATGCMMAHLLMMGAAGIQMEIVLSCRKNARRIPNLKRYSKKQPLGMRLQHLSLTADCPSSLSGL